MDGLNIRESSAVSVLMPVYNTKEQFLREAVESILNQTFKDFELIIILDCPTDGSAAVVRSYHDDRIIIIENEQNLGIPKSLNKGLAIARGKYIAKMAADDISLSQRLEKEFSYMEEHLDVDALGSDAFYFGVGKTRRVYSSCEDDDVTKARMLFFNAAPTDASAFIRRTFLAEHEMRFNESYVYSCDYRLWTDLVLAGGRIRSLREVLVKYRFHEGQITQKEKKEVNGNRYTNRVICSQVERLLGPINDHELAVHNAIYRINPDVSIEECDAHITRLIESNQQNKLYEPKSFRKVILSIWLLTEFRMLRRLHSARALKSKYLLPSLAPSVVLHTAKWKLHC